ncbi:MAG TPA: alpha-2-macroglobulin family protein [Myxococcota bacterium]|nr:alpha-2-macroglobulin family protein [Myxococcota bacterium]
MRLIRPWILGSLLLCVCVALGGCPPGREGPGEMETGGGGGPVAEAAPPQDAKVDAPLPLVEWSGKFDDGWKEFDKLTNEQKYEAASKLVVKMIAKAAEQKDSQEWTRALIRYVQLRTALHGYEKAVRFLKEQSWPEDLLGHSVLELFFAESLVTYGHNYSWEIRKREKVEAKGKVDLKAWTMEQIFSAAGQAYLEVFKHRDQLGDLPGKSLGEYIRNNDYPRKIRGSLRDAVCYLWVQLLADTTGWRPEQSNEIAMLPLKKLLGSARLLPASVSLGDPALHPLLKIAAILGDLESFHATRGEAEAAFEAHLELLRRLHASFTQADDRLAIKQKLKERLRPVRKLAWWSVGMATLAEFTRVEEGPDSLIRARKIAIEGQRAFPDSIGGRRCLNITKSIEAPAYQLAGMAADAPQKRSILVTHKNLEKIFLRAYKVDLQKHFEASKDYDVFLNWQQLDKLFKQKPARAWSSDLPATPDFRMHKTFVVPAIEKAGFYVVAASAREDFSRHDNQILAINMVIGGLTMVTRQEQNKVEVTVLSGENGRPVPGVKVYLYKHDWNTKHHPVDIKTTGRAGTVDFRRSDSRSYFLLARKGDQLAIDPSYLYLYGNSNPRPFRACLIYTDRSIYRPHQKIRFKVIAYSGGPSRTDLKTVPSAPVTLSLMDANYQKVASKTLTTNSYGSAAGEFDIPGGRLLGRWQIQASPSGNAMVRVEEYKRPTFEVKFKDPTNPLRLNRPATLTGDARYYFGLPVTNAGVRWRVTRTPVYPWWWSYWYWGGGGGSQTQTVATGAGGLGADGEFKIEFTPKADERLGKQNKDVSYRYSVSADVTDEGGETRSSSRAFRLGFVAVEAALSSDENFFLAGRPAAWTITRTNLDGNPAPGRGSWRLVSLVQPARALLPADQPLPLPPGVADDKAFMTRGDRQRTRWNPGYQVQAVLRTWKEGAKRAHGKLTHDTKGKADLEIPALAGGAYRLHYETLDAFGASYTTSHDFVVADKKTPLALPALLEVERNSVKVGKTARILAQSGLSDQLLILDLYRDGKRFERRQIEAGKDAGLIEIPITEKDRGGFGLTLWVLNDHQLMRFERSVFVPWDNKELKIEFGTFRDKLTPGTREKWSVKVTGPAGKDTAVAAAEVLAYMYDRSLDSFAPHNPPVPLALFPWRTGTASVRTSLGQARNSWVRCDGFNPPPGYPTLQADSLYFYSGYGIGGPGARGGHRGRLRRSLAADAPMAAPMESKKKEDVAKDALAEAPASEETAVADDEDRSADKVGEKATGGEGKPAAPVALRSNFSETAFFLPQLLTGPDGSVTFEYLVPDSVTSWNVWVHAITRDLSSGSLKKEARSVKDLMVRPYLPRFLREGDLAQLKVVVNNASDKPMQGTLTFDIVDADSKKSLLKDFGLAPDDVEKTFSVKAGSGTNLTFAVKTPPRVGMVAFKVAARSGAFSDGELRPLPILPSRVHLAQSRFVSLKGDARRVMKFDDLAKNDDPTRIDEQMVVTLDAQLFYSVLSALPYLVNYPYECTEQTLNRFISTGILAAMYKDYPAIERMAKKFAARKTRYERWDADDPNRKMALEETPWLQEAQGGRKSEHPLINVLDPRITRAQRDASLAKLKKAQTSIGAFPWFPGGPPSPYMTLYILYGFSKALEFGVDVPKDMVQRAWSYMKRHYVDHIVEECMAHNSCWEFITFLNYVLSNYPDVSWTNSVFSDADRRRMLDFSFRHWREHSPYLKGYLALTLHRMERDKQARLVWESVMDSAKTEKDMGTFWAPEERAWLWYNDTIETHAFAVRTLLELMPKNDKLDGLVLWLFLNKKLNHWKSTRATAEVIYSLAKYLKQTNQLGVREAATVTIGDLSKSFVFEPDEYTGKKNQIVIPGPEMDPAKTSTITVEKHTPGYMFASATWHFSTEKLPVEASGDFLKVTRKYFKREKSGREAVLRPLAEGARLEPGDEIEVHLSLTAKHPVQYVHLRDPRPAGCEPASTTSRHRWALGIYWYEEVRDSGMNFFFENLPQGEYPFSYRMRAAIAGNFRIGPATVQPMYAPEFSAYSSGTSMTIKPAK